MDILVYLLFFVLVFIVLYQDTEERFIALFLGTILFPACVAIIKSPYFSPQNALLYGFFAVEIVKNYSKFKEDFLKFPLKIPLLIIAFSYLGTSFFNGGLGPKALYNIGRQIFENYAYIFAAYIVGSRVDFNSVLKKLFWPVVVYCGLGIFEGLFAVNYPYKWICSAFPVYDGYYDLASNISVRRAWRIRTCITTKHPTALGTLLCCLFLVYLPKLKDSQWSRWKNFGILGLLGLNLYLCGSRTALLCTGIAVAFFLIRRYHPGIKIFVVGACCFASVLYIHQAIEHFSQENRGSSISLRQEQLIFSALQIAESPIFGNGLFFTSKTIFERDAYGERVEDDDIGGLESIVFFTLIDQGIVGLLAWYMFYTWVFLILFRRRNVSMDAIIGYIITMAAVLYFTLSGNMGNNIGMAQLIIGALLGSVLKKEECLEKSKIKVIKSDSMKA